MRSVLVFCEGHHDVVFVQRSLGAHGSCTWVDRNIGDLPSPFGSNPVARRGLIASRLRAQKLEEAKIQAATHLPPPIFASIVECVSAHTMYFLINSLGKWQTHPNLDLIRDVDLVMNKVPPGTFEVSEYSAAFLFDANSEGVAATLSQFRDQYCGHFGDLSGIGHGRWVMGTAVPVGCFVFHKGPQDERGTLEDHLAPMVKMEFPERYAAAEHFIDHNRHSNDEVSKSEANRHKAVITATGQFNHPGAPMSVIIGRDGIPSTQFQSSRLSTELAEFLTATPWKQK